MAVADFVVGIVVDIVVDIEVGLGLDNFDNLKIEKLVSKKAFGINIFALIQIVVKHMKEVLFGKTCSKNQTNGILKYDH